MKQRLTLLVFALAALLVFVGCDKKEEDAGATAGATGGATAGGGDEGGAAAGGGAALPSSKLKVTLPASYRVSVGPMGDDTITGDGMMISVSPVNAAMGADQAAAKAKAEAMPTFKALTSEETLGDGWVLAYQTSGNAGDLYAVQVRRKLGETEYSCTGSMLKDEAGIAKVIEICKSLAPM